MVLTPTNDFITSNAYLTNLLVSGIFSVPDVKSGLEFRREDYGECMLPIANKIL